MPKFICLFLLLLLAAPIAQSTNAPTPKATSKETAAPAAAETATGGNIVVPLIDLQGLLPPKPAAAAETPEPPPEPSFGAHILDWIAQNSANFAQNFQTEVTSWLNPALLDKWLNQQRSVPRLAERWHLLAQGGGELLGYSALSALLLHLLLTPARRSLRPAGAVRFLSRLGRALSIFVIGLVPVIAVIFCTFVLLADPALPPHVRLILQGLTYALVVARLAMLIGKLLLAPQNPALRLLPVTDDHAPHLYRWLRAVAILAAIGLWLLDAARILDVPPAPRRLGAHILGLVLLACLLFLIRRNRDPVAQWLRGTAETTRDLWGWARSNLAAHWHRLTTAYLIIGYTVTILSPHGAGFTALLQGTLITVIILLVMNILLFGLNQLAQRAAQAQMRQERLPLHQPILRVLLRLLITGGGIYYILLGWNVDFSAWWKTDLAQRLIGASFSVSTAIILAVLGYEILCSILNRLQSERRQTGSGSARLQTLVPLLRNSAAIILTVAVILIGLSELGMNIAPLLAGAGILGVAVGFGSQALVKDIITGMFIIIEDTLHIGDVITCGTHAGVVESMTIRTLRLRDINGALHVLPYSEVTGFINQTRGFAFAVIDIGVAYDTDLRRAFTVLAEIGQSLQQDPALGQDILAPAEVMGIQNFADSAIILRTRLKTLPGQQWKIRYAYLLAMKERFAAEAITIPFPTVTHQFSNGAAPTSLSQANLASAAMAALPPNQVPK